MNRCTIVQGSSTARWLITAHRLYSTGVSQETLQLLSKWKLPKANEDKQRGDVPNRDEWQGRLRTPRGIGPLKGISSRSIVPKTISSSKAAPVLQKSSATESTGTFERPPKPSKLLEAWNPISPIEETDEAPVPTTYDSIRSQTVGEAASPFKRRPLPVSPLMNPAFIEARRRPHLRKAPPSTPLTDLQQELAKNPYALALATPVRRCAITNTSLPSYFLQDFRIMAEPKTGDPWYVPSSLKDKYYTTAEPGKLTSAAKDGLKEEKHIPKIGYQVYTLGNKSTLQAMQNPSSGYKQSRQGKAELAHRHFIPGRMRRMKAAMRVISNARWRDDMDEFVPELMRRRVVETLVHCHELRRGYVVGCKDWDDALKKPQVAAFLWTGGNAEQEVEPPGEFATLDVGVQDFDFGPGLRRKKRKVPVHNLRRLLGKDKLAELRRKIPNRMFERDVLVLKHKKATVDLQMKLWKLQGYLAEHRLAFDIGAGEEDEAWDEDLDDGNIESGDGDLDEDMADAPDLESLLPDRAKDS